MKETILICDFCGSEDATSVQLKPLAIGKFYEGEWHDFTTPASHRFNTVHVEICDECAAKSAEVPIVSYSTSDGITRAMFTEGGELVDR
jgi:hypothetical protein